MLNIYLHDQPLIGGVDCVLCGSVNSIQTNYFPTMANVLREKSVFNLSSAQVACEPSEPNKSLPLPERTSFVAPFPGPVVIPCKAHRSLDSLRLDGFATADKLNRILLCE